MPCCPTATVHMEPFSISAHSARRLLFGVYIGQHPSKSSCSRYDLISQNTYYVGPIFGVHIYTYIYIYICIQLLSLRKKPRMSNWRFTWSPSPFQPKRPTIWGLYIKSLQYWGSIYVQSQGSPQARLTDPCPLIVDITLYIHIYIYIYWKPTIWGLYMYIYI